MYAVVLTVPAYKGLSQAARVRLPQPTSSKKNISNAKRAGGLPAVSQAIGDIQIPEEFDGQNFLLFDSADEDAPRFFILGTDNELVHRDKLKLL